MKYIWRITKHEHEKKKRFFLATQNKLKTSHMFGKQNLYLLRKNMRFAFSKNVYTNFIQTSNDMTSCLSSVTDTMCVML